MPTLAETEAALAKLIDEVPDIVGQTAVDWYKDSFKNQGFTDNVLVPWKPRRGAAGRDKTLVHTANLRDSLRYRAVGNTVVVFTGGESADYARIHNRGGTIAVTPRMRRFFWAMHAKAGGGVRSGRSSTRLSRANQAQAQAAIKWKRMALSKKITIPKRQFIGESAGLRRRISTRIVSRFNQILGA
jgi:phage gpG-like protein